VAAVLGTVGGLTTSLVVADPGTEKSPTAFEDPLNLGIPLVNQPDCTGESILLVAWGSSRAPLDVGIANNTGDDVRYLKTEDSCPTLYGPFDKPIPEYAVYLGPYDSLKEGCTDRLSLDHKGDNLTNLSAGNEIFVKCICVLSPDTGPELSLGMDATTEDGIWIRGLQGVLNDINRLPDDAITGIFDERTQSAIRNIQLNAAATPSGIVDEETWRLVQDRACGQYVY
jgi:peptidoglycan hydrolase-like protein with peptidoglycan-binding domain